MNTTFNTSAGTFTTSTITPQDMNAQLGQIAQQANDLVQLGLPSSMTDTYVQNATAGIGDPNSLYNTSGLNVIPSSTCTTCSKVTSFWDGLKSVFNPNSNAPKIDPVTGTVVTPGDTSSFGKASDIFNVARWATLGIGALFIVGGLFMFTSGKEISIINEVAKTE